MADEILPDYEAEPETFDNVNSAMKFMAKKLRLFLRDEAGRNHLLLGQREFEWLDLYEGIEDAIGDFNVTQPSSSYDVMNIPRVVRHLIYMRATVYCLRSAANQQARNQNQYSDQGFSLSESDKAQMYLQMAGTLETSYEEKKMKFKAEQNAASTWGGMYSDPAYSFGGALDDF